MENASKALIMAGGVLLAIMIVGLIIFAWGRFSSFYNQTDDLSEIKDVTEFNLQFTNYDREDVHGYELISLVNKVADYNFRYSTETDARSDAGFQPISLTIDFTKASSENFNNLLYSDSTPHLFDKRQYIQSEMYKGETSIEGRIKNALNIEKIYSSNEATKLAKTIKVLFAADDNNYINTYMDNNHITREEAIKQLQRIAVDTYNANVSDDVTIVDDNYSQAYTAMKSKIGGRNDVILYYEYIQFKKSKFKCAKMEYNDDTGRVSNIVFEFEKVE